MRGRFRWARGPKQSSDDAVQVSGRDKELGLNRPIARRDFLQGAAIAALAGGLAPELAAAAETEKLAQDAPDYYPPTRLGMRGSHPGSFEAAHELRDGDFWNGATTLHDMGENFDLVVVGGGISGLSAAYFYRQARPAAKILILDNHDDFGGHAKRNEFHVAGHTLLMNGGTLEIDSPYPYSAVANGLMKTLGVDPPALEKACNDPSIYAGPAVGVFRPPDLGADRLVVGAPKNAADWKNFLARSPLGEKTRASILRIQTATDDPLPGLTSGTPKGTGCRAFLIRIISLPCSRQTPASCPITGIRPMISGVAASTRCRRWIAGAWVFPVFRG